MNKDVNSCLMLAVKLDTPVNLGCVFDSEDLTGTGIEFDTHITLLYAQGELLPKNDLLEDVKVILGEKTIEFLDLLKKEHDYRILDFFHVDTFENDSDYLVLKLNEEKKDLFNMLNLINKGLRLKYDVSVNFDNYAPHITLAELNSGTAKKYKDSDKLHIILEETYLDFEDLIFSSGEKQENGWKQYHLTSFNSIPRYFRLFNDRNEYTELSKGE